MPILLGAAALLGGCHGADKTIEPFGKVYYLDGSGNWGFGTKAVPKGLRRAGYPGDCEVFNWSLTLNPALDQMNVIGAKVSAKELANRITKYHEEYPHQEINIIALSAGTGVATWALEHLGGQPRVNNVFFLGSSLSNSYDMRDALKSVSGQVYNYYSHLDHLLTFVQISGLGTIDRKLGVKSAGQVGFKGQGCDDAKLVNIGWQDRWGRLGWHGAHTDYVNRQFIQYEIARKLMHSRSPMVAAPPAARTASAPARRANSTLSTPSPSGQ
jgi:hypothetical protein